MPEYFRMALAMKSSVLTVARSPVPAFASRSICRIDALYCPAIYSSLQAQLASASAPPVLGTDTTILTCAYSRPLGPPFLILPLTTASWRRSRLLWQLALARLRVLRLRDLPTLHIIKPTPALLLLHDREGRSWLCQTGSHTVGARQAPAMVPFDGRVCGHYRIGSGGRPPYERATRVGPRVRCASNANKPLLALRW